MRERDVCSSRKTLARQLPTIQATRTLENPTVDLTTMVHIRWAYQHIRSSGVYEPWFIIGHPNQFPNHGSSLRVIHR